MSKPKSRLVPTTPQERAARHRRQVLLQIWLPLGLGILLFLGLAAWTVRGAVHGSPEVGRFGNISSIFLLIPSLITNLIPIVLLALITFGVYKLLGKMPVWLALIQGFFARVAALVRAFADKIAAPLITAGSISSGLNAARKKITR